MSECYYVLVNVKHNTVLAPLLMVVPDVSLASSHTSSLLPVGEVDNYSITHISASLAAHLLNV